LNPSSPPSPTVRAWACRWSMASQSARIQLVFSDVLLPDGIALELVDQLLSSKEDLRVVLSSGYTDERAQWPTIRERCGYPALSLSRCSIMRPMTT